MIENLLPFLQLLSDRQRIEASSSVAAETSVPPPPSYEEINGSFASQTYDETADTIDYFLGEVDLGELVWMMYYA